MAYNGFTEAQERAHIKYMKKFATIQIRTSFEQRERIKAAADADGESTNTFINRAINELLEREGKMNCEENEIGEEINAP